MQNNYPIRKKSSRKRNIILIVLAVVLLGVVIVAGLEAANTINLFGKKTEQPTIPPGGVNLEPATEEEKQAAENQKEEIVKEQEQPSNPAPANPSNPQSNKKAVSPIIIRSGGGEVAGFIPGIVENGGTCTATFTNGSNSVVLTSTGFANATTTNCTPISYAGTAVQPGWNVTLAYSSSTSEGVSGASAVQ